MKKSLLTSLVLGVSILSFNQAVYANSTKDQFQQGVAAYNGGNYHQAFQLFKSLAEQGDVSAQFNLGFNVWQR